MNVDDIKVKVDFSISGIAINDYFDFDRNVRIVVASRRQRGDRYAVAVEIEDADIADTRSFAGAAAQGCAALLAADMVDPELYRVPRWGGRQGRPWHLTYAPHAIFPKRRCEGAG